MMTAGRTAPSKVMILFVVFMVQRVLVLQVVVSFTLISGISGKSGPADGRSFGGVLTTDEHGSTRIRRNGVGGVATVAAFDAVMRFMACNAGRRS
jgi:hypothetical protein